MSCSKDRGEDGSVVRCSKDRGEGGSVVRCSKDRGEGGSVVKSAKIVVRCSKDRGEGGSVVRCSKDCGEVVNNWLVNLRRTIMHAQCSHVKKAGLKGETSNELTTGCGFEFIECTLDLNAPSNRPPL